MDPSAPDYRPSVKEMPETERPRERLLHQGADRLTVQELLAIILRTGVPGCDVVEMSRRLVSKYGLHGLARASTQELCREPGLGPARVAQLKAALELGRRLQTEPADEHPLIQCPQDVANLYMLEMQALEQEQLRVLLLDTKHRLQDTLTVYVGSLNSSPVRVGELFREAVRANCAAVVVVHNHPSGDPTPSREDVAITRQMVDAGKLLNVGVLDHIVLGHGRYVSLLDRGESFYTG
jgi:DNA repair protein RadC